MFYDFRDDGAVTWFVSDNQKWSSVLREVADWLDENDILPWDIICSANNDIVSKKTMAIYYYNREKVTVE